MSPAEALDQLAGQVLSLARELPALRRRLQEVEETMATRAELQAGLTQMEAALRAAVATIGTAVSDLAARIPAEIDLQPEMDRVNAATQTLTQLSEAVQESASPPGS